MNEVKVLPGVEIHGDRRDELEHALVKLLRLWVSEREELLAAAVREVLRHGLGAGNCPPPAVPV